MEKALRDIVLAATVCHLDVTVSLLQTLIGRLWLLAVEFSPLVPDGLYLPAPPVYCAQPAFDQVSL